jgi:hypothetical protein
MLVVRIVVCTFCTEVTILSSSAIDAHMWGYSLISVFWRMIFSSLRAEARRGRMKKTVEKSILIGVKCVDVEWMSIRS